MFIHVSLIGDSRVLLCRLLQEFRSQCGVVIVLYIVEEYVDNLPREFHNSQTCQDGWVVELRRLARRNTEIYEDLFGVPCLVLPHLSLILASS